MRLMQFSDQSGQRKVAVIPDNGRDFHVLEGAASVYDLAKRAVEAGHGLKDEITKYPLGEVVDCDEVARDGRLLPAIDHPEPSRFWITGTGLTHIGSADARDKMHDLAHGADNAEMTDSMKIFKMGIEGGKPADGGIGVQPEWFYKGVGTCVVPPEADMPMPSFALAGGEEAEIVGVYIIGEDGNPWRLGYVIGNEFSDHVTEAQNYLYLAHSKLRACSLGPELLLGDLPGDVRGNIRVVRDEEPIWEGEFISGETNMSHSIRNLEHYHFRYDMFRRPGDLHAYFFGASLLSCANGIAAKPGDRFEIDVPIFGRPLRNTLRQDAPPAFTVRSL